MIKEIKIYSRFHISNFAITGGINFPYVGKKWNLVSIYGCGDEELLTLKNKNIFQDMGCENFLSLDFWDITPGWIENSSFEEEDVILFNKDHASQVVSFIDDLQKDDEDSILVAHCHAGISRSGAIGTFACDYCNLDYNAFMKSNSFIMANPHVLETLHNVTGKDDIKWHNGWDDNCDVMPPWKRR